METQSLSHQTTKEVLNLPSLKKNYFFLAALGLHCIQALSSCAEQGLLSIVM